MISFNYNGKLYKEGTAIIGADNRGLRYGDGLFETLKFKNDHCILFPEHLNRLWTGMEKLQFELPALFTRDYLKQQIQLLLDKNKHSSARVRLSVFRANGGLYDAANHQPQFIIQTWPLPGETAILNSNGLQVCIFKDAVKTYDSFCNLKHNNFLPYLMGALYAKANKCNDAILLNNHGRVCDSTIANVFIIKDNKIYTPPLTEACVAGVMRNFIIEQLPLNGFEINVSPISPENLLAADEVFLSNTIYNMKWVAAIGDKNYDNLITKKIFNNLQQTNSAVFC